MFLVMKHIVFFTEHAIKVIPTAANLVTPFSSAQDLTWFQSDWSWVQFEFATVKGFRPVRKEISEIL